MKNFLSIAYCCLCLGATGSAAATGGDTPIVLTQGMVLVIGGSTGAGGARIDWETLATVTRVTPEAAEYGVQWFENGKQVHAARRRVRSEDMASAKRINDVFQTGDADTFPGATLHTLSTAAFTELKQKGESAMVYGTLPSVGPLLAFVTGRKYYRGTLKRVAGASAPVTVLVNGVPRTLATMHVRGEMSVGGDRIVADDWWYDDARFPLRLKESSPDGSGATAQLLRIDYPVVATAGGDLLQSQLAGTACRAELHGIYFDSGSAFLLPQSTAVLQSVAALAKANAGWRLTVEGHTDDVGNAATNLALSQARAEAVRAALVAAPFAVPPAQLRVQGFGLAKPVASNASLEGRARNRRVELARDCKS